MYIKEFYYLLVWKYVNKYGIFMHLIPEKELLQENGEKYIKGIIIQNVKIYPP